MQLLKFLSWTYFSVFFFHWSFQGGSTVAILLCSFICMSLFLSSSSFGASGRLCFVIVAYPGCLNLYFCSCCNQTHHRLGARLYTVPLTKCPNRIRRKQLSDGNDKRHSRHTLYMKYQNRREGNDQGLTQLSHNSHQRHQRERNTNTK